MKKKMLLIIAVLLAASVVVWYYYFSGDRSSDLNRADGVVDAPMAVVGAEVAGTVVELKVEEGEEVSRGQLMAVLVNEFFRQQKKVAEKKADVIQAQLEAAEGDDGVLEARLDQAREEIKPYQTYIDALRIRAPEGGVVESWLVEIGQVVSPGQQLARLVKPDEPYVNAYVTQNQLASIGAGKRVKVELDALPGHEFTGRVVWIATEAEFTPKNVLTRQERAEPVYQIKVEFEEEPEGVLPGMTATVSW